MISYIIYDKWDAWSIDQVPKPSIFIVNKNTLILALSLKPERQTFVSPNILDTDQVGALKSGMQLKGIIVILDHLGHRISWKIDPLNGFYCSLPTQIHKDVEKGVLDGIGIFFL